MNQDEILRALEACKKAGTIYCDDCPLQPVSGCMHKLLVESKKLIQSMLEKQAADARPEPEPWTRRRVLIEAEKCVCGQREQDYGTPEDSFEMIGKLWTVYLNYAKKIDAHDVAAMMALLKIARIAKSPDHMDSWCDLAGYASCGGEIAGGCEK